LRSSRAKISGPHTLKVHGPEDNEANYIRARF
jgi:hypothetical protein